MSASSNALYQDLVKANNKEKRKENEGTTANTYIGTPFASKSYSSSIISSSIRLSGELTELFGDEEEFDATDMPLPPLKFCCIEGIIMFLAKLLFAAALALFCKISFSFCQK